MGVRLKREEHEFTCHDSVFSPWKILVGCFDWDDYDRGKHGIERYRTCNLPIGSSSPGLYELGLVSSCYASDHGVRHTKSKHVIVVYLGEADNVRIRLQHYGRAGSHLDHGNSIRPPSNNHVSSLSKGPGLFKEVFSKGFSIAYRWAQVDSKRKAVEIEAQLLTIYDYAWNKGGNGTRRRDDILSLLDKIVFGQSHAFNIFDKKPHIFGRRRVGIQIDGHRPFEDPDEKLQHSSNIWKPKLLLSLLRRDKLRPHLASKSFSMDVANMNFEAALVVDENKGTKNSMLEEHVDYNFRVCGVQLEDGSICLAPPVLGRKRCMVHKGSRLNSKPKIVGNHKLLKEEFVMDRSFVSDRVTDLSVRGGNEMDFRGTGFLDESKKLMATEGDSSVCGRSISEGISDNERKVMPESRGTHIGSDLRLDSEKGSSTEKGLGVCGVHRTNGSNCRNETTETLRVDHPICGVSLSSGSVCQNRPVSGRKRCSEHKGMRIASSMAVGNGSNCRYETTETLRVDHPICGVSLSSGSVCQNRPVSGRKRCSEHKGMRIASSMAVGNGSNCRNETTETLRVDHPICGVSLSSGSVCQNRPVSGRKRCCEHKGMRIARSMAVTVLSEQFQEQPSICGVLLGDGSICTSSPAPRRQRCELHKGRRVTNNCSF